MPISRAALRSPVRGEAAHGAVPARAPAGRGGPTRRTPVHQRPPSAPSSGVEEGERESTPPSLSLSFFPPPLRVSARRRCDGGEKRGACACCVCYAFIIEGARVKQKKVFFLSGGEVERGDGGGWRGGQPTKSHSLSRCVCGECRARGPPSEEPGPPPPHPRHHRVPRHTRRRRGRWQMAVARGARARAAPLFFTTRASPPPPRWPPSHAPPLPPHFGSPCSPPAKLTHHNALHAGLPGRPGPGVRADPGESGPPPSAAPDIGAIKKMREAKKKKGALTFSLSKTGRGRRHGQGHRHHRRRHQVVQQDPAQAGPAGRERHEEAGEGEGRERGERERGARPHRRACLARVFCSPRVFSLLSS